jgi:enoyl-[acyl-carrier-protein] reductase (NADH)
MTMKDYARCNLAKAAATSASVVKRPSAAATAGQLIKAINPKDIATLAVFLASDVAKSISGQVLPIDNDR